MYRFNYVCSPSYAEPTYTPMSMTPKSDFSDDSLLTPDFIGPTDLMGYQKDQIFDVDEYRKVDWSGFRSNSSATESVYCNPADQTRPTALIR